VGLKRDYEEYVTKTKMSRLFGMGDSKQIENTEKELQNQMQATKTFSDGINMEC